MAQATTCPPGVICSGGAQGLIPEFFFEPEVPPQSLKHMPTWNEIEQLLDNPNAVTTSCTDTGGPIRGNQQGYPTYCTNSTIVRRPASA
jgi:hypothetical protein